MLQIETTISFLTLGVDIRQVGLIKMWLTFDRMENDHYNICTRSQCQNNWCKAIFQTNFLFAFTKVDSFKFCCLFTPFPNAFLHISFALLNIPHRTWCFAYALQSTYACIVYGIWSMDKCDANNEILYWNNVHFMNES